MLLNSQSCSRRVTIFCIKQKEEIDSNLLFLFIPLHIVSSMVEPRRVELLTSCVQGRRSTN